MTEIYYIIEFSTEIQTKRIQTPNNDYIKIMEISENNDIHRRFCISSFHVLFQFFQRRSLQKKT